MNIFVNGEKLDVTLENEKTIGDFLYNFQTELEKNKLATTKLIINDKKILGDDFDSIQEMPLEDSTKIEFWVISENQVIDNLKSIKDEFLKEIMPLSQISVELQSGRGNIVKDTIIKFSDTMNDFCTIVAYSHFFPDTLKLEFDGQPEAEFITEFENIFKDFSQALSDSDTVLIGDLAEYEICPRLEIICKTISAL